LVDTLLPIFTIQKLGWTNTEFSHIFSISTIVGGISGMMLGGLLVDYFGKKKMMSIYLVLLVVLLTTFSFIPQLWAHKSVIFGFIFAYYILYTFLTIAVFATAMNLCWKTVAATQFTLFMTLSNTGRSIGSWLIGVLKSYMIWDQIFLCVAVAPLLGLILFQFINLLKHQRSVAGFSSSINPTSTDPEILEMRAELDNIF
ncbi:MAG: MFS transporter, partial [Saprospiraceae bacterium]